MEKSNRIISILFILLSIYVYYEALSFPKGVASHGPDFMPRLVATILLVLSGMLFISTFLKKDIKYLEKVNTKGLLFHIGFMVLFAIVLNSVGVLISVPIFLFAYFKIYGDISNRKNAILSISITVVMYILFVLVLKIPLPNPLF